MKGWADERIGSCPPSKDPLHPGEVALLPRRTRSVLTQKMSAPAADGRASEPAVPPFPPKHTSSPQPPARFTWPACSA
eukprot:scaffold14295_cov116-Isochrysis_galbana.AAC.6